VEVHQLANLASCEVMATLWKKHIPMTSDRKSRCGTLPVANDVLDESQ
jgi:hypothetical protein